MSIHPSSIVHADARIGANVTIGPFCTVGPHVTLGDGCELISHVVIDGHTTLGPGCRLHPFVALGHGPQVIGLAGGEARLTVGANCVMREHVTMNVGTPRGGMHTRVGDNCYFMINAHVAHDCILGDNVTLVNNVMLAGHCEVNSNVIMAGGSAIHQFTRVGQGAFIGGLAAVEHDVIPYGLALGNRAYLGGLNIIGLKRRGAKRAEIHALRQAYKLLFSTEGLFEEQLQRVDEAFAGQPLVDEVLDFIRAGGKRRILTPRSGVGSALQPDAES